MRIDTFFDISLTMTRATFFLQYKFFLANQKACYNQNYEVFNAVHNILDDLI